MSFKMRSNCLPPAAAGAQEQAMRMASRKGRSAALATGCALSLLAAMAVSVSQANAQSAQVGTSTKIQNTVTGSSGNRRLAVADPVFASEQVSAAASSLGELRLNDNSRIVVGENSVVTLDDFAIAGRGFSDATIRVAQGALRFITGNSPKGAFNVETPLSTIGVKGTFFDVYVKPNGVTWVVLFRGEVEMCSGGTCLTLDQPCDVGKVGGPSDVTEEPFLRSGGNSRDFEDRNFFLSGDQRQISAPNRALTAVCSVRAAVQPLRAPVPNQPQGSPAPSQPQRSPAPSFPQWQPGDPQIPDAPEHESECGESGC